MVLFDHCLQKRLIFIVLFARVSTYTVSDANSIHTALFTGYNHLVLPEYPTTVQAEYNLLTINSLDTKTQTLSTSGWFTVIWTDSRLSWTTSSYGNIEYIYASQELVWHPELIVENSVTDLSALGEDDIQVRIRYDGEIRWEPPAILFTSCDMDVTYFPYDVQTCNIELASWGFHTDAVNLTFYKNNINLQDYRTNGEWDLVSTSQYASEIVEDGLTYCELLFRINLERLPGYYIMSVIFPVILTSILTAVTFVLPVESGEKVGYILTVLLSLAVLLTLFADNMPTTSKHTSVLVLFLTVTLGLASIAIIITVLIIRLFHKPDDYTIPRWLYKFVQNCKKWKTKRVISITNINTDINNTVNEENNQGEKVAWNTAQNSDSIMPHKNVYSNKDLAEFFDNLFFIVFVILYVLVVFSFTITLSVAE